MTTPAPRSDHEKKNITLICKPMMMVCETQLSEKNKINFIKVHHLSLFDLAVTLIF